MPHRGGMYLWQHDEILRAEAFFPPHAFRIPTTMSVLDNRIISKHIKDDVAI